MNETVAEVPVTEELFAVLWRVWGAFFTWFAGQLETLAVWLLFVWQSLDTLDVALLLVALVGGLTAVYYLYLAFVRHPRDAAARDWATTLKSE